MTTKLTIADPDAVEMTLTVTMPLRNWKRLRTQLTTTSYPACDFSRAISDMTSQAEASFAPESGGA